MFLELFRKLHKPQSKITKESSNQVKFEPKKVDYFGSLSSSWAAGRKVSSSAESG